LPTYCKIKCPLVLGCSECKLSEVPISVPKFYVPKKLKFERKNVSSLYSRINNNCQQSKFTISQDRFDMPSLLSSPSTFFFYNERINHKVTTKGNTRQKMTTYLTRLNNKNKKVPLFPLSET